MKFTNIAILICILLSTFIYPINCMKKGFLASTKSKEKRHNENHPPITSEQIIIGEPSKNDENVANQALIGQSSSNSFEHIQILSSNEENPVEEVKIRVLNRIDNIPRHAFVVVGNYEFDFLEGGARRRKFRHDIHNTLNNSNKKKSQSFKKRLFVVPSKASEVFFEMSKRFWYDESHSPDEANCLDFVYNFVCALFDGKCPKKKVWPVNFVELDADMTSSYRRELRFPPSVFKRQLRALPDDNDRNCLLTDQRVQFRLIIPSDMEFENNSGNLNFVLFHITGRFHRNVSIYSDLSTTIYVQTLPEKVWLEGNDHLLGRHIRFDAVLKAYRCQIDGNGTPWMPPFVANLLILNETTRKRLRAKSICHSHFICTYGPINLDQITDHIVQIDVDGWSDVHLD